MNIKPVIKKALRFAKDHLPEILTILACAGIPLGDIFLIRADRAYKVDGLKRHYVIPITIHGVSFLCIILSNRVSNAQKISLAAAGAISAQQFQNYRQTVKEQVGEEKYNEIEEAYNEEDLERLMIEADEADELDGNDLDKKFIYYFPQLHKIVQCDPDSMNVALLNINEMYEREWQVSINDFFNFIDRSIVQNDPDLKDAGDDFGWVMYDEDPEAGIDRIMVNQYSKKTKSGVPVTYIHFMDPPLKYAEWQDFYEKMFRLADEEEEKRYER